MVHSKMSVSRAKEETKEGGVPVFSQRGKWPQRQVFCRKLTLASIDLGDVLLFSTPFSRRGETSRNCIQETQKSEGQDKVRKGYKPISEFRGYFTCLPRREGMVLCQD